MPNEQRTYGYARVSSSGQNERRQIDALVAYGVQKRDIFIDKSSGKDFCRPEYAKMKSLLREGDEVVILDLDRLGRSYDKMAEEWRELTKSLKCDITILNCPILSTKGQGENSLDARLIADVTFQLLSYTAARERESIRQRQKEGIESAKGRGVSFGRPPILKPLGFDAAYEQVLLRKKTSVQAMSDLGLKPNVYYKFVAQYRKEHGLS